LVVQKFRAEPSFGEVRVEQRSIHRQGILSHFGRLEIRSSVASSMSEFSAVIAETFA
jgi:hypothetical protein